MKFLVQADFFLLSNGQEIIELFLKDLYHGLLPAAKAAAWRILPQGFINLSSVPVKWQQSILNK